MCVTFFFISLFPTHFSFIYRFRATKSSSSTYVVQCSGTAPKDVNVLNRDRLSLLTNDLNQKQQLVEMDRSIPASQRQYNANCSLDSFPGPCASSSLFIYYVYHSVADRRTTWIYMVLYQQVIVNILYSAPCVGVVLQYEDLLLKLAFVTCPKRFVERLEKGKKTSKLHRFQECRNCYQSTKKIIKLGSQGRTEKRKKPNSSLKLIASKPPVKCHDLS